MSKEATRRRTAPNPAKLTPEEQLRAAREIVRREAAGVWKVSYRLNSSVCEAVKLLFTCKGSAIVTGMGKAGIIGQKIAATLSSTGTRAHFLHPAEAFHGDLGRVHPDDVVVMLTQSGETAEVVQLLPSLREFGVPLVAITASHMSTIGQAATVVIELGELEEVCSLGLAPSTSTTAMLAVGDALALVLSKMRNFQADDFARFHPGGALGRRLSRVDDIMRPLAECRQASEMLTVRQVIVTCSRPGRRSGAIMLTNKSGRLTGLFTDSDLARLFERRDESALDQPIRDVMATKPTTVPSGTRVADAIALLAKRKFSELPVVDSAGRPIGLIDVTDVVGLAPPEADSRAPKKAA
ncbi:MAG TPA: KpsF/GutQ family sugar-phosphate isomerase [Lacipirellulaceae bacterium]|jgi:arabinose-5-phosphate isomerase|nr:KpsF/GutQ family sugar-phosphate isomerase [Lacipirellulaceae bacterium]